MKLLYLLFSFTTGGTERLVCDICNEMAKRDHQVHLYVVNDLYDQSMLDALDSKVCVQLQKRPAGGGGKLQTLLQIAKYIRRNHIDVVHCNSLDAPELLLLKPFFAPRARVLYTVHGMHQMRQKSRFKIMLRNLLCYRVIAISQCVKEDIIAAGIKASKVVTVPNAVDLSRFVPTEKTMDPEAPVIGNVARIQPQVKGQDVLIRAISLLKQEYPHIRCLFAGGPAKSDQVSLAQLQDLTAQLELTENISFVGNITDVPTFLSGIDIFALPSRSEGFGISLVEAMAMGIPCIASNLEGPAEVMEQGKYGWLFPCEDAQALAAMLSDMIRSYDRCLIRSHESMTHVQNTYHIRHMCDRLEALVQS